MDNNVVKNAKIKIPVQINSKNIVVLEIDKGSTEEETKVKAMEHVNAKLNGRKIIKVIFVPDRIINFVVK